MVILINIIEHILTCKREKPGKSTYRFLKAPEQDRMRYTCLAKTTYEHIMYALKPLYEQNNLVEAGIISNLQA